MKVKIILFTIISVSNFSYGQITELKDTIKGNVKSFKETWYEAKALNKGFQKSKYLHDDEYFKNENNIFEKKTIFPLEKYEIPQKEFNSKNELIKSTNYYEDGNIINKTLFVYENGLLMEEKFFLSSDTIENKKIFQYQNKRKQNVIEYIFNKDENKFEKFCVTTYEYDDNNQIITENIDYKFQDDEVFIYKFNNKQFLTEIQYATYNDNEKPVLKPFKKINYISDDGINWLSAYFIDEFDKENITKPTKIYFIERQINYEK